MRSSKCIDVYKTKLKNLLVQFTIVFKCFMRITCVHDKGGCKSMSEYTFVSSNLYLE